MLHIVLETNKRTVYRFSTKAQAVVFAGNRANVEVAKGRKTSAWYACVWRSANEEVMFEMANAPK